MISLPPPPDKPQCISYLSESLFAKHTNAVVLGLLTAEDFAEILNNAVRLEKKNLTAEDRAEIRENALRLRGRTLLTIIPREKRAKCEHGLAQFACYFCAQEVLTPKMVAEREKRLELITRLPLPHAPLPGERVKDRPSVPSNSRASDVSSNFPALVPLLNANRTNVVYKPIGDVVWITSKNWITGKNFRCCLPKSHYPPLPKDENFPVAHWMTPWLPHSRIADVFDASNGFNWWGYISGKQPNDKKWGTGGEGGQTRINDGFPTEANILVEQNEGYLTEEKIDAALADKNYRALFHRQQALAQPILDLGPIVRKVTRVYEGEYSFDGTPTVVGLFEPEPNLCLLARIAKERRRIRYNRDVEDERRRQTVAYNLSAADFKDLRKHWDKTIRKEGIDLPQHRVYVKMEGKGPNSKAKPVTGDVENNALVEMWIEEIEKPVDAGEITRLLRVYFRGATEDDVRDDEVAAWLYQESIDPDPSRRTLPQKKMMNRRMLLMKKLEDGKCLTGVCPDNLCANPELSFAERKEIHRASTAKFDSIGNLGRWFFWVKLNGQWYPKFLDLPLGETNAKKVQAAFREVVRREVRAAARSDKAERRAAYKAVSLKFMTGAADHNAKKVYVLAFDAKKVYVFDEATNTLTVEEYEG